MTYVDSCGKRYGLGLIPSTEDQRRAFCSRWRGATIPRAQWKPVDYRRFAPAIYDQGQTSGCVGHGGIGSFCTLRAMHGVGSERLSAFNLYGQINGGRDRGAMVIDALKALQSTGACLESTVGPPQWEPGRWPAGWKEEAKRFRIEKATEIQGFDEIATAILEGDPVNFGTCIGNRFEPGADGRIPEWDGAMVGGHCMFALGLEQFNGKWHALVQNSWSARWGLGGYCYMPESYFNQRYAEAYRLKAATDDPQGDNPPAAKAGDTVFVRLEKRNGPDPFNISAHMGYL